MLSENCMNNKNTNLRSYSRVGAGSSPLSAGQPGRLGSPRSHRSQEATEARPVCAWARVSKLPFPFLPLNIKITVLQPHPFILLLRPNGSSKVNIDCEAMTLWGAFRHTQHSDLSTSPQVGGWTLFFRARRTYAKLFTVCQFPNRGKRDKAATCNTSPVPTRC